MKIAVEQIIAILTEWQCFGCHAIGPVHLWEVRRALRVISYIQVTIWRSVLNFYQVVITACSYPIYAKESPADIMTRYSSSFEWYELMNLLLFLAWRECLQIWNFRTEMNKNLQQRYFTISDSAESEFPHVFKAYFVHCCLSFCHSSRDYCVKSFQKKETYTVRYDTYKQFWF
jgi:hypothetical protein